MQQFGKTRLAAGIAALMGAGLILVPAMARAQEEPEGVLVIKRADGSTLIRKPALTLEGNGETALKPIRYFVTVSPVVRGSYTSEEWAAKVKEVRTFLTGNGVTGDLQDGGISSGLTLPAFDTPDAVQRFVESLAKAAVPLQVGVVGYPKDAEEKTLRTAALAKALEDAEARRSLFAKAARPRELVLLSMEEGSYQLNPARAAITLENGKFSVAPNIALAPVLGPKAAAWVTMSATLRYGWKDEMGEGVSVPGVARAVAPTKPAAKSSPNIPPKKTATKQR